MTRASRATPLALATLTALALAACGGDDAGGLSPDLVDQRQTTTTDPDEAATEGARTRVGQWVDGRNTILASPESYRSTASIGFAEGRASSSLIAEAGRLDIKGQRREGTTEIVGELKVTKMELEPKPKNGVAISPFVEMRACLDESGTSLVKESGGSVAGSTGRGARPMKFHVSNGSYPNPDSWMVSWTQEVKGHC